MFKRKRKKKTHIQLARERRRNKQDYLYFIIHSLVFLFEVFRFDSLFGDLTEKQKR